MRETTIPLSCILICLKLVGVEHAYAASSQTFSAFSASPFILRPKPLDLAALEHSVSHPLVVGVGLNAVEGDRNSSKPATFLPRRRTRCKFATAGLGGSRLVRVSSNLLGGKEFLSPLNSPSREFANPCDHRQATLLYEDVPYPACAKADSRRKKVPFRCIEISEVSKSDQKVFSMGVAVEEP